MVTAAKVVTDETPWVRMAFSDGVESLFLMHWELELLAGVAQASTLGSYENGERTVLMGTVNGFGADCRGQVRLGLDAGLRQLLLRASCAKDRRRSARSRAGASRRVSLGQTADRGMILPAF
ncbi:MAG: hypothetical protein R3E96_14225 [Planctomycetota bacterium]